MTRSLCYVLIVSVAAVFWAALSPGSSRAQGTQDAALRPTGTVSNLFETLDPSRPVDALRITLPEGWAFEGVRLLRYGTEPVSVQVRPAGRAGGHLLTMSTPIRGPHDLVVRARTPELAGPGRWHLQTLRREASGVDSTTQPRFRTVDRWTHRVIVEAPSLPDRGNRALSLAEARAPLRIRADALPRLGQTSPFTIEFWVQTNGLDEVLLSTWTGNEAVSYPAEFVVDQGGRLRFYSGRPGRHRALQTGRPIADGQWHHVAVVYEARRSRLRLLLDGRPTDSLRGFVPPASGPTPVAVGGRLDREQSPEAERPPLFSGQIDELRIWGEARSTEAVQRMRNRPVRGATAETSGPRLVRLGFDDQGGELAETGAPAVAWPEGARRVSTALSFRSSLRDLRAKTEGRAVTLRWVSEASDVERFIVERATGQRAFARVATLTPEEAAQAPGAEGPAFTYTDPQVAGQIVFYRIRLKRADGTERTSSTIKIGLGPEPEEKRPVKLIGNFPNPFSKTTTVAYEVNDPRPVTITVWDLQGHKIAELADAVRGPGYHEVSFDATDLPSGNYFLRLQTPTGEQSHKMVVLK